jgi:hypothetical protein
MDVKELRRDLRAVVKKLKHGKNLPAKTRKALRTRKNDLTRAIEDKFNIKRKSKKKN